MTRTSINHDTRADKVLPNTASVTIFIHVDVCTGVTKTPPRVFSRTVCVLRVAEQSNYAERLTKTKTAHLK